MHGVYAKPRKDLRDVEVIPCQAGSPGYSFYFDLIADLWPDSQGEGAVHRLCSLMRKMGAATLLKEELEPNQEIKEEFEDIITRIGRPFETPPEAYRLSFFAAPCRDGNWQALPESSFLGYAVVLRVKLPTDVDVVERMRPSGNLTYILEAVTHPPSHIVESKGGEYEGKGVTNYYVHCKRAFKTTVGTRETQRDYVVDGAMFCQQNGLTHVCAHAVLRMILNTDDRLANHKVTNRELNGYLGINHGKVPVGEGLTIDQVHQIGKSLGLVTRAGLFLEQPTVDYAEFIYPLVESGYPVCLAFSTTHDRGHVLAVIGHTMNSDKWDCEAHLAYRPEAFGRYHASASWVDHFIVNDDNFGMYTCMPVSYLRNKMLPQYDMRQRAIYAFSFLPGSIDVIPYLAEKVAISLVSNLANSLSAQPNKWLERVRQQIRHRRKGVVARTVICSKRDYIEYLRSTDTGTDSDGRGPVTTIPGPLANAPDDMWLTEISLPDLYTANKRKLGDILTDAQTGTVNGQSTANFVWGWLPGMQLAPHHGGSAADLTVATWPLTGHVKIFRHDDVLGPDTEW